MELHLSIPTSSYPALAQIEGYLGSLRTLHLRATGASGLGHKISIFRFAPNLTTVIASTQNLLDILLPWTQITTFMNPVAPISRGSRTTNNMAVLRRLPSLQKCTLSCRADSEIQSPLELADLRVFVIQGEEIKGAVASLIRWLTLPSLRILGILGMVDVECVTSLLSRSRCNSLEALSLTSASLDETSCRHILNATPSICKLTMSCINVNAAAFFRDLVDNPSLVPGLMALVFKFRAAADLDPFILVQLAETRPGLKIDTVVLDVDLDPEELATQAS